MRLQFRGAPLVTRWKASVEQSELGGVRKQSTVFPMGFCIVSAFVL